MGCKTKQTTEQITKTETKEAILVKKDSITKKSEATQKSVKKDSTVQSSIKSKEKEIEINGKAETGKPLILYDIENGDTLQIVHIVGTADVRIKTKRAEKENSHSEKIQSSAKDKIEIAARSVVNESNIKKVATTVKEKTKSIFGIDFTTGFWIVLAILGVVAVGIYFIKK